MPKIKPGRKFGSWLVIRKVKTGNGVRAKWLCECKCGKRVKVIEYNLKSGDSKSCGCWKTNTIKIKSGKRYNWWLVIRRIKTNNKKHSVWLCECKCGKIAKVYGSSLINGHSKSCGCYKTKVMKERIREKNPLWKGGRHKDSKGYIHIRKRKQAGIKEWIYIFEHRLVMEQFLGRKLTKDEQVHHKNGVRDDNRLKNLELWTTGHPKGFRVKDLILYAKSVLRTYAPHLLKGK